MKTYVSTKLLVLVIVWGVLGAIWLVTAETNENPGPLVLKAQVTGITTGAESWVGLDFDGKDTIITVGVYNVSINLQIINVSTQKTVMINPHISGKSFSWKSRFPDPKSGCEGMTHGLGLIDSAIGPPGCHDCGWFKVLEYGQSIQVHQHVFQSPSTATTAIYKASISLYDDGQSCGKQAWTGHLETTLQVPLTNVTPRASGVSCEPKKVP